MRRVHTLHVVAAVGVLSLALLAQSQEPAGPQPVPAADLEAALNKLGDLDYPTRTAAARLVRRTAGTQAVPALMQAAAKHADGYVRYRALVLLTGFNDARTRAAMQDALTNSSDRLRAVAYSFFEHEPDPAMAPMLLTALEKEKGEFVRPALVRALAAVGKDQRIQQVLVREAGRGEDFFRSAVIEAMGDYQAQYALETITAISKLDGPLQDDAALALGRIGDKRALETLAGLQRTAPRERQPAIAAGICLLGVNCSVHENYLIETLKFAEANTGFQALLRSAAAGLGALGISGRETAVSALFEIGIPSRDPARAPIALAVATVALRNTRAMLPILEKHAQGPRAIELLAEGFEMLQEDLSKERFFAFVRRSYWSAAEGSPTRNLMQTLIGTLDF
jgi:HEAT repeat protein